MNYSYKFDPNIFNAFVHYSGGCAPTLEQYQEFACNMYYQQVLQTQLRNFTQPINNQIQPETITLTPSQKHSVCIKGMKCRNIKCNDYHHPSKDLDILNTSKK